MRVVIEVLDLVGETRVAGQCHVWIDRIEVGNDLRVIQRGNANEDARLIVDQCTGEIEVGLTCRLLFPDGNCIDKVMRWIRKRDRALG